MPDSHAPQRPSQATFEQDIPAEPSVPGLHGPAKLEGLQHTELTGLTFEVRTQLGNIIGFADMIAEDIGRDEETSVHDVCSIRAAATLVLELITRLEKHVDNAREEATQDPLTGIANRRAFDLRCAALLGDPSQAPLSLILIDLDRFKSVNDTLGHLVGDDVLKGVVHRCQQAVRDSDLLARYAGDEFVLLLPSTPQGEAITVANRVRASVVSAPIPTRKGAVPVTVSLGVATHGHGLESAAELVEQADEAMYRSKHGGRNQVSALQRRNEP